MVNCLRMRIPTTAPWLRETWPNPHPSFPTEGKNWAFRAPAFLSSIVALSLVMLAAVPCPATEISVERPELVIPRVSSTPPALEDFLEMKPNAAWQGRLAKVGNFIQRLPSDGQPITQRTDAYLGYDDKNLYCIFVAFDSEPRKVRAHLVPRDSVTGEDKVDLFLDTFHDQRRAFVFTTNAYGIQMDGLWNEGQVNQYDRSFDTVWRSRGKLTSKGFVVWMAIPFKSLRFPTTREQEWGIVLIRWIPRTNESATWPRVTTRIEGRLNQGATLKGLKDISPGRNVQFIPYGFFRSFRALDTRDPVEPRFVTDRAEFDGGLDGKFVLKDSFALDVAVNPDFSQVESDEPQVTVNRRFEVFFPEKRPFFLENSGFFETPINLLFTRRIADPQFGVRLTGKKGPYAIGALVADDESPGKLVAPGDPLFGQRAHFGIIRVSRDVFRQSSIGVMFTDREFSEDSNRVGAVDMRFKLTRNWLTNGQAVASSTRLPDGTHLAGPAYKFRLRRDGRQFYYDLEYNDRSPGFLTETGFLAEGSVQKPLGGGRTIPRPQLRTDIRSVTQFATYRFRPEGKHFISWGPNVLINPIWDHQGQRLDMYHDYSMTWEFTGATTFELFHIADRELLRPQDFAGLHDNRVFSHHRNGLFFETSYDPRITFRSEYSRGTLINIVPPAGQEPALANLSRANTSLILRPLTRLQVENTYILERLTDRGQGENIFNNHIIRSKWGWQFNRELSLRVILQYNAILANPALTRLETAKNFNADFLFTYLVNPWTALYVGYNGNAQNIELVPTADGSALIRSRQFQNDANQFFVKFSYLVRF